MSDEQQIWTFGEALDKVKRETSLEEDDEDENFISFDEFIGMFNDGIDEAEGEIMLLNQDYFLAYDYMPLLNGINEYDYPANIYANKIRGLIYNSGGTRYVIKKYPRQDKFALLEEDQADDTASQDIRWMPINNGPAGRKMLLTPTPAVTSILLPVTPVDTHVRRWYIRNANRIPLTGDYTNVERILPTAVNTVTNVITVDPLYPYVTGDQVKVSLDEWAYLGQGATLPAPLVAGTVYYVIRVSAVAIKLATTATLATAGTAIDLTTTGLIYFCLKVAATEAIIRATIIDIPEHTRYVMEWVKANSLFKDGDPRLAACVAKLEKLQASMVEDLGKSEDDDDDVLAMDFSAYKEMS